MPLALQDLTHALRGLGRLLPIASALLALLTAMLLPSGKLMFAGPWQPKAVYDHDDRLEPFELMKGTVPQRTLLRRAASVAVIMPAAKLTTTVSGSYKVNAETLGDKLNLCSAVRYAQQHAPGYCTGFLVGPQLLATAGHCIKSSVDCAQLAIAFDFAKKHASDSALQLAPQNVYRCSALVAHQVDRSSGIDFALVKLDRKVVNRRPLRVARSTSLQEGDSVFMLGHPGGIPLKVTTNGLITDHSHPHYLRGSIDSFAGNSGSPVFSHESGLVVGMLVRGEKSYVKAEGENCHEPMACIDGNCRGEDILRPQAFAEHIPELGPSLSWSQLQVSEWEGNGDGFGAPGETLALRLVLHNNGTSPVQAATLSLTSPDTKALTWLNNQAQIAELPPDAEFTTPPLLVKVAAAADCQEALPLELSLQYGDRQRRFRKDLHLGEPHIASYDLDLHEAIVDNTFPGTTLSIDLGEAPAGRKVEFLVDVTHAQAQQLKIDVAAPDGSSSTLFYRGRAPQGGFMQDLHGGIQGVYGYSLTPYQSIDLFRAVQEPGRWSFHIADLSRGHTGVVNKLAINLRQRLCH